MIFSSFFNSSLMHVCNIIYKVLFFEKINKKLYIQIYVFV